MSSVWLRALGLWLYRLAAEGDLDIRENVDHPPLKEP